MELSIPIDIIAKVLEHTNTNMTQTMKPRLKTPISYYGGQQNMLKDILPLIPSHNLYNEPYAGGAALLFAKEPVEINVINDLNGEIVNFYRTAVANFPALSKEIRKTLHSRKQMDVAKFIYNNPDYFSNVQRAWAVWAMSKPCFSADFTGSFSLCRTGNWTIHRIDRMVSAANTKRRKQEEWMVCNYTLPEA